MRNAPALLVIGCVVSGCIAVGVAGTAATASTGGTICKTSPGTATIVPALPKVRGTVTPAITMTAKLTGCVRGVSSATIGIHARPGSPVSCLSFKAGLFVATGTENVTWNTGATSKLSIRFSGLMGTSQQAGLTGTVTSGLFAGGKQSARIVFQLPAGSCSAKAVGKTPVLLVNPHTGTT